LRNTRNVRFLVPFSLILVAVPCAQTHAAGNSAVLPSSHPPVAVSPLVASPPHGEEVDLKHISVVSQTNGQEHGSIPDGMAANYNFGAPLSVSLAVSGAQSTTSSEQASQGTRQSTTPVRKSYATVLVQNGDALFQQNCSFCHGRDAGGAEGGPDLRGSKMVTADVDGDQIGAVVRNGRPDKGMPHFDFSDQQIASLVAFIHTQQNNALTRGRRGVDVSDLQTGNVEAGRKYFNGTGGCASCHSPTGDLAGIASRFEGLALEQRMLYPADAKSTVTVTLDSGQTIKGTLEYLDEFTVGLIDPAGVYRSWRTSDVKYKVDAPVNAHVELLGKYTDEDVHNLMAYLQTLR
jgi:cytochrome c oxidase cbb3-type subunit 3